jgi:hypothetical protein
MMISATLPMAGYDSTINGSMAKLNRNPIESLLSSILGRVGLVILTSMVAASTMLLLFWAKLYISSFLLALIVLTGIGLISGLASRWFLRRNTAALRLLAGLTGLSFSLALIGVITEGALGLNLTPKSLRNPDWLGLIQISWSGLMTWLILRAWRKPIRIKEPGAGEVVSSPKRRSMPKVAVRKSKKQTPQPVLRARSKKKQSPVRVTQAKKPGRLKRPKLHFKRRPEAVKLVGREEHNCPYCLEIVEKGDPRGVKVCSICKTWHHADCWSVTDACQVPHEH